MPTSASARRYAQAAFEIALEKGDPDGWLDDLTLIARSLEERDFSELLDAPQVSAAQKISIIGDALGGSVGELPLNLLSLLASRNAATSMPAVVERYQQLLDAHRGIERAEVVSAVPLDDRQLKKIAELLKTMVESKEVRLTSRVEPQILGGLVARVGDRLIDGSTLTRLRTMERELAEQPGEGLGYSNF